MTLKRTSKGGVTLSQTALPMQADIGRQPALRALDHLSLTPPMGATKANDAVTLLFTNSEGQIGHLANAQGEAIEMTAYSDGGGKPLKGLATKALKAHMPRASFNDLAVRTHEQTLTSNGRPTARMTYVLLNMPGSSATFMGPPRQEDIFSLVPFDASKSMPHTPHFVEPVATRQSLQTMAVAGLQAGFEKSSVAVSPKSIVSPVIVRATPMPAPKPEQIVTAPPAAALAAIAPVTPASRPSLGQRALQFVGLQKGPGRGGPQSNLA